MTTLTVESLQDLALPAGAQLVAGTRGLDREVTWTATLRTRAPGFQSLKGGEFLLIATATLGLLDPSLSLLRLLQSVDRVRVAGAAVLGEVPSDCVAWADEHDLPVFTLPVTTSLSDLESAIGRAISDARRDLERRAHDLYRQLTQIAIEERGLEAVIDELARVTGKPAWLLDPQLRAQQLAAPPGRHRAGGDLSLALASGLALALDGDDGALLAGATEPSVRLVTLTPELGFLLTPVATRSGLAAYVAVSSPPTELDGLDRAAVTGAAAAAAIEFARGRAVQEAEARVQAGVVEELLTATASLSPALRSRAERLGLDPGATYTVLVSAGASDLASVLEAYQREARHVLGDGHVGVDGGRLLLVTGRPDQSLADAAERLRQSLARRSGDDTVTTGVGRRLEGLGGLRQSYREGTDALALGRQLFGPGRTVCYADLGLYRLLLGCRDQPEVEQFCEDTMGKLVTYDARSDGELLRTLETYFACHGSPTEAAARLHVHRNTLLYRLQRIRTVAGLDLDDPEVRLSLQIALRLHRIRDAIPSPRGREGTNPEAGPPATRRRSEAARARVT
jgi:purine catabolism regulator